MSVSANASQNVDVNGWVPEKVQFFPLHAGVAVAHEARSRRRMRACAKDMRDIRLKEGERGAFPNRSVCIVAASHVQVSLVVLLVVLLVLEPPLALLWLLHVELWVRLAAILIVSARWIAVVRWPARLLCGLGVRLLLGARLAHQEHDKGNQDDEQHHTADCAANCSSSRGCGQP